MPTYTVIWEIEVEANSAEEAAEEARAIQLDEESEALMFEVNDTVGNEALIDLLTLPELPELESKYA